MAEAKNANKANGERGIYGPCYTCTILDSKETMKETTMLLSYQGRKEDI
jgi:hypothetical protein